MMRRLFSAFGLGGTAPLRKASRKGGRRSRRTRVGTFAAASYAQLSVEHLEDRIVLSATIPTLQMAPTTVATTETTVTLNYLARFTDVIEQVQGETISIPSNYSYTINWGDGSVSTPSAAPVSAPVQGVLGALVDGKIKGRHTYAMAGDYTVTVSLTEDDGIEVSDPVEASFTILVRDPFVPTPGDQQFQLTEVDDVDSLSDTIAEGSPVNVGFKIPESVSEQDVASWTLSWGDQTVTYGGLPGSVAHMYQDFLQQFASDGFDGEGGNTYYISAHVTLSGLNGGTYGAGYVYFSGDGVPGLFPGLYDVEPTVTAAGAASVGKDATYTIDLNYDGDVTADRPVVWQIYWNVFESPVAETIVGDPSSASHVYTEAGTYSIYAVTTNDDNSMYAAEWDSPEVFFWTVTVGDAPIADAGGPYTTLADVPIPLTGMGSGGTGSYSFAWDLDDDGIFGETGGAAGNGNEDVATPTFIPNGFTGSRTVGLKVTDSENVTSEVASTTVNVLAQGALVVDGNLHVVGSSTLADNVSVTLSGGNLSVQTGNGTPVLFPLGSVGNVEIRTGGGNDVVLIAANVTVDFTIDGGDGNDILVGGGGNDVLLGGTGNDLLLGGGGNDALVGGGGIDIMEGGAGRDLMVGGVGNDILLGGNDDDIIIGGTTVHDGDVDAINLIMATWTSGASFNQRVADLTGVGGLLEANVSVLNDNSLDIISGGGGRDLIFGDTNPFDGSFDLIALQRAQDQLIALN
jgi:Ca2+-binding RTX toxin-like protein